MPPQHRRLTRKRSLRFVVPPGVCDGALDCCWHGGDVRIATWNVNSVTVRLPRLLAWLSDRAPDVLLLQETKCTDEAWPAAALGELGYESAHLGKGRWNGVAVLSRVGLTLVTLGLPGQPRFEGVVEPRAIGATCAGVRLWSLYVPNGRKAGSAHYAYKLAFLDAARTHAAQEAEALAGGPLGLLGDFNVAPTDADVWGPGAARGRHARLGRRAGRLGGAAHRGRATRARRPAAPRVARGGRRPPPVDLLRDAGARFPEGVAACAWTWRW
jgi:exodeoxyribonuclease III